VNISIKDIHEEYSRKMEKDDEVKEPFNTLYNILDSMDDQILSHYFCDKFATICWDIEEFNEIGETIVPEEWKDRYFALRDYVIDVNVEPFDQILNPSSYAFGVDILKKIIERIKEPGSLGFTEKKDIIVKLMHKILYMIASEELTDADASECSDLVCQLYVSA
jgi:hypothetical protein